MTENMSVKGAEIFHLQLDIWLSIRFPLDLLVLKGFSSSCAVDSGTGMDFHNDKGKRKQRNLTVFYCSIPQSKEIFFYSLQFLLSQKSDIDAFLLLNAVLCLTHFCFLSKESLNQK